MKKSGKRAEKDAFMDTSHFYDKDYYEVQGYGFTSEDRMDHKRIMELLKIKESDKVLDVGCGTGQLLLKIPAKYKKGTEFNDYAVKFCRKKSLDVVKAPAEKLPYKDASFDIVILNEVISHLRKPSLGMKEALRVLKKTGRILVTGPVRSSIYHNLSKTHLSEMSASDLRTLFNIFNLKILNHEVAGLSLLFPILENMVYKPFRFVRKLFLKNSTSKKPLVVIDSCHSIADKTLLKPLNTYRPFLLELGLQQIILARKTQ